MSLIKPKAPRWYRQDASGVVEVCYEIPKKRGGGTKSPDIDDAIELHLFPSVTEVIKVVAKPGLVRWQIEQAIHSALTLPRPKESYESWRMRISTKPEGLTSEKLLWEAFHNPPGYMQSEDDFADAVVRDMEAQANEAAVRGSRIHDAIAYFFGTNQTGKWATQDQQIEPYIDSLRTWANQYIKEIHAVEKVVGGKHCGYAGRMDLECTLKDGERALIDFKTQSINKGKKPTFYKEWGAQLAAYAKASEQLAMPTLVSIVIPSLAPGPVTIKQWEYSESMVAFFDCFSIWKWQNEYDPCNPSTTK